MSGLTLVEVNTHVYNNHSPGRNTTILISSYRSSAVKKTLHVKLLAAILSFATTLSCTTHTPLTFNYVLAGSPTVTSLTFDDQSRTLTCTSTGGPATTVTWRRDGVVITLNATHQQTKRLVDPGNGTYETVLTFDPSVNQSDIVGTYNCTVENVRGESSETVVVPGET